MQAKKRYHGTVSKKRMTLAAGPGFYTRNLNSNKWKTGPGSVERPDHKAGVPLVAVTCNGVTCGSRQACRKERDRSQHGNMGIPTDTLPKFTFLVLTRYGYILVRNHDGEKSKQSNGTP